ncbi:MAG: hypothetical protein KTR31_05475 [Myxococcales bacterium]|nr:hypothetical protein [Myxococcales bacterium]
MRSIPLLTTCLVGCINFTETAELDVASELPEMDLDCDPSEDDVEENGNRVVSKVEEDPAGCRGSVYVRTEAITWDDIAEEIGDNRLVWRGLLTSVDTLTVTSDRGPIPAGVQIGLEQLVATDSTNLADYEADPYGLIDAIGSNTIDGSDRYLMGLQYTFDGTEPTNLVDVVPVTYNNSGPIDTLTASWDNDPSLQVITVASVVVPDALLDESPTIITVELSEDAEFEAKLRVKLF